MAEMRQREKLDRTGRRILNASRTELTLAMPFLTAPLNTLSYVMDLSTTSAGTDAVSVRFNPQYLLSLYVEQPARLNRLYLHMLLHCLFGHMFSAPRYPDAALWNLCCDIAVESVIDDMDNDVIRRVSDDFREKVYEALRSAVNVITAERLYAWFTGEGSADPFFSACLADESDPLAREFHEDDHGFWARMRDGEEESPDRPPLPQIALPPAQLRMVKEAWERDAKRVKSELDLLSGRASRETGSLAWTLSAAYGSRTDFRDYLRKLAVVREEARPDPDQFHYGLYRYGLELYGNLPLIEELEVREARKIDELVIAIDTSASCARDKVQRFLDATCAILKRQETFFHRVDVRILECDDRLQQEILLPDVGEMQRYARSFTVKGGYGTDFRPVFSHIAACRAKGALKNLRALLYFTDGYGVYPKEAAPYDTAFVFAASSDYNDRDVPPWAMKLYMTD